MNEVFKFLETLPLPLALGALSFVGSLGVLGFTLRWSWRSVRHLEAERARHKLAVLAELERVAILEEQAARCWAGYRKFQVVGRVEEDSLGNIATFQLKPFLPSTDLDLSRSATRQVIAPFLGLPSFKPGQYLQVRVDLPGQANLLSRCYSLSRVYREGEDVFQITVGRVPGAIDPLSHEMYPPGVVSSYLLDSVHERAVLDVAVPQGDFLLEPADSAPAVLVGWGIHAVPLICMFEAIARSGTREAWLFLEIVNEGDLRALLEPILNLAKTDRKRRLRIWLSFASGDPTTDKVSRRLPKVSGESPEEQAPVTYREGRQAVAWIKREVPSYFATAAEFYVSGPALLLREAKHDLEGWGISAEKYHFEVFDRASLDAIAEPETSGVSKVTFDVAGKSADWDPEHRNLLGLAAASKVRIPSTCKIGKCGECEVSLVSGQVRYAKEPDWKVKPGHCLPCVATPASTTLVLGA